jgi:hypothetical protein
MISPSVRNRLIAYPVSLGLLFAAIWWATTNPMFPVEKVEAVSNADSKQLELTRTTIPAAGSRDLMISLEMIGFYTDEKGSQAYPIPIAWLFYPSAETSSRWWDS